MNTTQPTQTSRRSLGRSYKWLIVVVAITWLALIAMAWSDTADARERERSVERFMNWGTAEDRPVQWKKKNTPRGEYADAEETEAKPETAVAQEGTAPAETRTPASFQGETAPADDSKEQRQEPESAPESAVPAGESQGSANRAPASARPSGSRSPSSDFQGSAPSGDDEYNFNWLDPEKKIYVLQNRRYVKAKRLMLSVMGGPGFSAPYRSTYNLDPRMAYYFSESWGVEVFFRQTFNIENNTYAALQQASGSSVIPVVRELRSAYGGMVHWVPWYAKINVFNKILYFDWYFGAGLGGLHAAIDKRLNALSPANYVSQDMIAAFASTGHQYSITHNFLVRLDVTATYYRAPVFGDTGDSSTYSNYDFGVGIGFRL